MRLKQPSYVRGRARLALRISIGYLLTIGMLARRRCTRSAVGRSAMPGSGEPMERQSAQTGTSAIGPQSGFSRVLRPTHSLRTATFANRRHNWADQKRIQTAPSSRSFKTGFAELISPTSSCDNCTRRCRAMLPCIASDSTAIM